jgi:type I restriction enzyme S subunit
MNLNQYSVSAAQPGLAVDRIKRLLLPVPLFSEQQAIAAYLDTKTAQIDRKIDLLNQKATQYGKLKQSLINETVTRGLDKTVTMKNSGVDWVGEVPEHWGIKRVKEISTVFNGATPKSSVAENWDGELSWVTTDDLGKLNTKFITDTKRKITEKGYASCGTTICPIGSVVISGRAPIGHIGILSIKASSNQGCKTLVLNHKVANNLFIFYSLLSSKSKLEALGRGTTFIELSTKELGLFNLPMPPFSEQTAIANYLDEKTALIDQIITTINTQIDKLKELRKTLINDVVTGKIKVFDENNKDKLKTDPVDSAKWRQGLDENVTIEANAS